jgi:hypothetical protein
MSEIGLDHKTVERFSNELKLARKIVHKNVARRIMDFGVARSLAAKGDHGRGRDDRDTRIHEPGA